MRDLSHIGKVRNLEDEYMICRYLEAGWEMIEVASGRHENGEPCILAMLGLPRDVEEKPVRDDRIKEIY